ncbi:MAG: hypothetical protein MUO27_03655 [Sedimentisphaerales bacterium]|nr:hypothetical protein [Sedimentisphaerales bacterium]
MALIAPLSKYKKKTFIIWMAVLVGFAAYCVYDGYFNEDFRGKHTGRDGKPDGTLAFNQKAPPFLVGVAVLMGAYLFVIRNRKVVAEENGLVIDGKISIAYGSIQKIDKTHFDSKGHFTLTYRGPDGKETDRKLSDKDYDNLQVILDHLVAKIS